MIVVPNQFVFLHVPKTGGSFVASVLRRHCEVVELEEHGSVIDLPSEYEALPKFVLVRDPWAWYVSWYEFQLRVADGNPVFAALSDSGRLGFRETVLRALGNAPQAPHVPGPISHGVALYRWWWWFVTRRRARSGPPKDQWSSAGRNVEPTPLVSAASGTTRRNVRASGPKEPTALSARLLRLTEPSGHPARYAPVQDIEVGRQETLRADFLAFLERHEIPGQGLRKAVLEAPAVNEGSGKDYRGFYDSELAELVGRHHPMITRYGYEFWASAPTAQGRSTLR